MIIEYKICRICGIKKPISDFRFRNDSNKYRSECKDCCNKRSREWRAANKNRVSELNKAYRVSHLEKLTKYSKQYQKTHLNKYREYNKKCRENWSGEQKARVNERERKYREIRKNDPDYIERRREWNRASTKRRRAKITAYEEARKKTDPVFKLKTQVRNEVRMSFQRRGFRKSKHTEEIVGCSLLFLYEHLLNTYEARYGEKYNGSQKVHIDHIKPLARAHTEKEVIALCKWDNLQLLRAEDNLLKSDQENTILNH
jgi:hypothetical protein